MLGTEEVMLAVEHHMVMLPGLHLAMLHWLHMPMQFRLQIMVMMYWLYMTMLHQRNSRVQEDDQLNLNHRFQRCSKHKN
jgi:hypothetical protein